MQRLQFGQIPRDGDPVGAAEHATRAAYLICDQGDRYVQVAAIRQLAVTIGPVEPALAAELLGVADGLLPEVRVIARDAIADARLREDLRDALGADDLEELMAVGGRHDTRTVYATVERALHTMRTARSV
jgi:hypothetical protein